VYFNKKNTNIKLIVLFDVSRGAFEKREIYAVFKLSEVKFSNIFAINSTVSKLTDMTALDNKNCLLHSQRSENILKFDSEMKFPQLRTLQL
jgi:hypothetical protein